jgi:hypothetical protein
VILRGVFVAIFALLTCSNARAEVTVIQDAAARITADPIVDAATRITSLDIKVSASLTTFALISRQRAAPRDAIAAQKAHTGWQDGYLFVRDACADAGKPDAPWRCARDHVFEFADAKANKGFTYIGEVFAGDDCIEEAKLGCALYKERFTDIYDALEKNPLVSRDDSPLLFIEMQVKNGKFVVDLDETWGRNQERFKAGDLCLSAAKEERTSKCTDGITPLRAAIFNAALAAYSKRADALMRARTQARTALCESLREYDCAEALRSFDTVLAGVKPGELPKVRGEVKLVPVASKTEVPKKQNTK